MAKKKKKILLFIVEGQSEKESISTVLSRIFSSSTVQFRIVRGDLLVQDFVEPEKIAVRVGEEVSKFCGHVYHPTDICQIIHLVDTDGAYIPDSSVLEDHSMPDRNYPYYTETAILTSNPNGIIDRNRRKRNNLSKLLSRGKIMGIPYSIYYFSSNLDHVLFGKINLTDREKTFMSEEFDMKYGDDPEAFISFLNNPTFAVSGTYSATWAYIKKGVRSLQRHSNFATYLPSPSLHPEAES